jgi:HSP20 family molecular chaperone IbpA
MGFRRVPGEPFGGLPEDVVEASLRILAGGRPAHPAIEETEFPALDVFETASDVVVEAELPGVEPADITVSAGEGLIVIEGAKQEQTGPGRVNFLCMERTFGAFRRVVLPGAAVDISRATAVCRDGILQVRVPKVEEKRGRIRVVPVTAAKSGERSEP